VTPTWYDLLGVEPDASADEIRAAWKAAITDLDPGDRQFRTLNEAAEVLLDADRRAAYDATLEPEEELAEEEPAEETPPDETPPEETASESDAETRPQLEQDLDTSARRTVPAWLVAVLAVLTALALAAAGYLLAQPSDDKIAAATTEAQSAAEHATPLVLTYDFRHLDEDQKAVQPLLTSSYRKEYDRLLAAIEENADRVKPIVSADVTASGIVRASADRVVVLVLLERHVANAQGSEPVYQDQVRVTMERDGDDWLVDKMETQRPPA
jgi:Mce-associated membrane protein